MTMGPDSAARLRVRFVTVGRVIVEGAEATPMIMDPATLETEKPLEMKRLVVCIVIGPAKVRLNVSPVALSIATPVVNLNSFEMLRLAPLGRKCWLAPLLTVTGPVPS